MGVRIGWTCGWNGETMNIYGNLEGGGCRGTASSQNQIDIRLMTVTVKTRVQCLVGAGIATCYGLDGPGIESRWGVRFSAPVQTGPGAHPTSYTIGIGSFPGVKRTGCDVDHKPPSTAEAEERVELFLYSTSGPSWPVQG